jgi:hypothetical protein
MARLQVGNIRIDGSDVYIGPAGPGTAVPSRGMQTGAGSGIRLLTRFPGSGGVLMVAGLAVAAVGTAINVALEAWNNPVGALVGGGVLAPVGVGLLVLGAAREYLRARPEVVHRAALGDNPDPYLARLRGLLSTPAPHQTVAWITRGTGWDEATALHALALLRCSGELLEEVDLETGDFYYVAQPNPSTPGPADLNTRLGTLTPQGVRRE